MMGKMTDYQAIILAGLLHDIGKFYQRTGAKFDLKYQSDQYDYENFTKKYGEGASLRYSYLHGAFTAKFFRENLSQYDEAGVIAALHHVPEQGNNERQKFLARLIALADRMSSGERQDRDENEESGHPQEEPLTSIFSQLELEESDIENGKKSRPAYYIPLSPLQESLSDVFPVQDKKDAFHGLKGEDAYKKMWGEFLGELKKLSFEDHDVFLSQIYHLLLKYTLSIPSAVYRDKPDISLFHHLKTTSALAACLYKLSQEEGDGFGEKINRILEEIKNIGLEDKNEASGPKEDKDLDRQDFLLVGGDISGIQDFIYQVTSEKALKGLRARSFYLQLLSEIVARKVLSEFDMKEVNLLYCGGGNFYLLLPNLKVAESKLKSIQRELDEVLIRAHKGKIATILSWVPVSYRDFFQNFAALWEKLGKELSISKRRKFSALIASGSGEQFQNFVLGPFDQGGEAKGCKICGEEIEQSRELCSLCESLISFSGDLVRARAISIQEVTRKELPEKDIIWSDVFQAIGFKCEFLSSIEGRNCRGKIVINSTDFAGRFEGFTFIAKNVPALDGQTLILEEIAERAHGIEKWGVLRADVDNLGRLFQQGLGKNKTISRVSMLSSMLSLYFSARISQLRNWAADYGDSEGLADFVYVAYSGGDDLFLIAPWSVLPDLAKAIYGDFRKFTCERLTLSAGIFFAPGKKFPIYQAAKMAGEAEDKAKDDGRNRINLFGESMSWECFPKVKEIIALVTSLVDERNGRGVPRSLLGILYNIYQEREKKKKKEISMERVWRLHYSLKKLMRKFDENTKSDIQKLFGLIITNYEVYPYLNIATRVADYLTRK